MRRLLRKAITLAAVYAFALQSMLALTAMAAFAADGASLPPAVLCSGNGADAGANVPAGNDHNCPCGPLCVMPGCGAHGALALPAGEPLPRLFAKPMARLARAALPARLLAAVSAPPAARAPPRA
jgi:hypothetical protein